MNRRHFIKCSGALLASSLSPVNLTALDKREHYLKSLKELGRKKNSILKILYPKGSFANVNIVMQAFQERFGIQVQGIEASVDNIASEMFLKYRLGKSDYDVAIPATFSIPDLASAEVIEDLSTFAFEFESDDFFTSSLYRLGDHFLGKLYGYQADGDAYILFYNELFSSDAELRKRFEDQFQKPLVIPRDWNELEEQIRFFHAPDKNRFGGSLFRNKKYIAWEFWIRLHARGLLPMDEEMIPQLSNDIALEELEKMIQLNAFLEPGIFKNGLFENFQSYAEGNKYCNLGWGGTQKYIVSNDSMIKNHLSYTPTLSYSNDQEFNFMPFFNWGWNYVVSSKSKNKLLAYLFCLFASSKTNSTSSVRQARGYFDPHRSEHYADEEIISLYGNSFLDTHKISMMNSIPDFYVRGHSQYMTALKNGLYAANLLQIEASQALQLIQDKWQRITDKLGRDTQIKQWLHVLDNYPNHFRKSE